MTGSRLRPAYFVGLFLALLVIALQGVQSEEELEVPPEDLCRPYIEKALKDLGTGSLEQTSAEAGADADKESQQEDAKAASEEEGEPATDDASKEDVATEEEKSAEAEGAESAEQAEEAKASEEPDEGEGKSAEAEGEGSEEPGEKSEEADKGTEEEEEEGDKESVEQAEVGAADSEQEEAEKSGEEAQTEEGKSEEDAGKSEDEAETDKSGEAADAGKSEEDGDGGKSDEGAEADDGKSDEAQAEGESAEQAKTDEEKSDEEAKTGEVKSEEAESEAKDSKPEEEETEEATEAASKEEDGEKEDSKGEEDGEPSEEQAEEAKENKEDQGESEEGQGTEEAKESEEAAVDESKEEAKSAEDEEKSADDEEKSADKGTEEEKDGEEEGKSTEEGEKSVEEGKSEEEERSEKAKSRARREVSEEGAGEGEGEGEDEGSDEPGQSEEEEPTPEEDLIQEIEVPENLRPRDHINHLLRLDEENEDKERAIEKIADVILKELKRVYDNAIQPLESLYKYRDLSNRHFGDPEIFSKPLVLFMGPWSGGKSSIINYLLDIEYKHTSLRTGAEPSPAYFNIIMHGEEEEILDGTQLAADWTFSGLQKFGQGMLDRLKGLRQPNKLLEKVNIVEIPGILEIRKQVQRLFPFNDACQWFIDRADIIFLVYDPSKLDVGPETEAILDQLKGREHQTRIILNKADQVKPEELMRVQGALIWNISPLMSSAEPPIMYSTSLWSLPYEAGAPTRLLYAQERAFLRDLRTAIDKRVEHKIASARRFAVRVRNHAKMVDCYLTTYYNHKTFFGNKKEISDKIIENPQDYHIYEGLSTLKNISRYDLPDPDVYRDFFRLNPLYDFPLLSSTCTYFRGCPINRLDVAIAYDLPELVGKYKKSVEQVIHEYETSPPS